jgi:hypothetical protein
MGRCWSRVCALNAGCGALLIAEPRSRAFVNRRSVCAGQQIWQLAETCRDYPFATLRVPDVLLRPRRMVHRGVCVRVPKASRRWCDTCSLKHAYRQLVVIEMTIHSITAGASLQCHEIAHWARRARWCWRWRHWRRDWRRCGCHCNARRFQCRGLNYRPHAKHRHLGIPPSHDAPRPFQIIWAQSFRRSSELKRWSANAASDSPLLGARAVEQELLARDELVYWPRCQHLCQRDVSAHSVATRSWSQNA